MQTPLFDASEDPYPVPEGAETVFTVGHGTRPAEVLVETLARAGVRTLVDVRRFPSSRRNPQFNSDALAAALAGAGIEYRHAVDLGGRVEGEPGEERFSCLREPAFRSYVARMATEAWQAALRTCSRQTPPASCAPRRRGRSATAASSRSS